MKRKNWQKFFISSIWWKYALRENESANSQFRIFWIFLFQYFHKEKNLFKYIIIFGIFHSETTHIHPDLFREIIIKNQINIFETFELLPMILKRIQLVWFTNHKGIDFNERYFMHQSLFSCLRDFNQMRSHKRYENLNARQWPLSWC